MNTLTTPVPYNPPTFADLHRCDNLEALDAHIAILGVPFGTPGSMESSRSPSSTAPATIREKSLRYGRYLPHVDIDLGGPLFNNRDICVVDCGDVIMDPASLVGNSAATTKEIRTIRGKNAIPSSSVETT